MSNKIKDIDIKNRTYHFFDDIIDPNKTKVEEKSYKNIVIYYNGYVRIKDFEIYKNYYCKSFTPYYQQSKWIL